MGFSSAYYIPKKESKKGILNLSDEFKKYQLLRTGALFGMNITNKDNKIFISNGKDVFICVDGKRMPDSIFITNMLQLKNAYNTLQRYSTTKIPENNRTSFKYNIALPENVNGAEDAYQETYDPITYVENLLTDLENNGKQDKALAYKKQIESSVDNVVNFLRYKTSWGSKPIMEGHKENMADSLQKFWETSKHYVLRDHLVEIEKE